MSIIEARGLWKTYTMGAEPIHALADVDVTVERGSIGAEPHRVPLLLQPEGGSIGPIEAEVARCEDGRVFTTRKRELFVDNTTEEPAAKTRARRAMRIFDRKNEDLIVSLIMAPAIVIL